MVTSECVMVRNCPSRVDHCFRGSGFDRPELLNQLALFAERVPCEVWCWPIWIKMGKAHRTCACAAGYFADCAQRRFLNPGLELHVTLPGDAAFCRIAHHAACKRVFAQRRAAQELIAPVPGSAATLRIFLSQCITIPVAAIVAADLQRPIHPRLKGMICRLERKYQKIEGAISCLGKFGFVALDQPSVSRVEPGLADCSNGGDGLLVVMEAYCRRPSERRSTMQSHPRFGDDAQRALRTQKQPIGIRSSSR